MVYRAKIRSLIFAAVLVLASSLMGSAIPGAHASDEPIKVGAPIPITGPFASDGFVMEKAEKLAIADINAQGGLLGRQIEMIVYDIGDLTPDKLQAAALNLVEQEEVHVLINGYGGMGPDIPAFCPYDVPYLHVDGPEYVIDLAEQMGCNNIYMFIRHGCELRRDHVSPADADGPRILEQETGHHPGAVRLGNRDDGRCDRRGRGARLGGRPEGAGRLRHQRVGTDPHQAPRGSTRRDLLRVPGPGGRERPRRSVQHRPGQGGLSSTSATPGPSRPSTRSSRGGSPTACWA